MKLIYNIIIILTLIAFASCEKVIDLKLNTTSPKVIIEGNLSNNPLDTTTVMLTTSIDFTNASKNPPITGAAVSITKDNGAAINLVETKPGIYTTTSIQGVPLSTYNLKVVANGITYNASSTMPRAVLMDTVYETKELGRKGVRIEVYDPVGFGDKYYFIQKINGKLNKNIFYLEDDYDDGILNTGTINNFRDRDSVYNLKPNDVVSIEMQCVDKNIIRYITALANLTSNSTVPANPPSNFNNGALGYFSAFAGDKRTIIIK